MGNGYAVLYKTAFPKTAGGPAREIFRYLWKNRSGNKQEGRSFPGAAFFMHVAGEVYFFARSLIRMLRKRNTEP